MSTTIEWRADLVGFEFEPDATGFVALCRHPDTVRTELYSVLFTHPRGIARRESETSMCLLLTLSPPGGLWVKRMSRLMR